MDLIKPSKLRRLQETLEKHAKTDSSVIVLDSTPTPPRRLNATESDHGMFNDVRLEDIEEIFSIWILRISVPHPVHLELIYQLLSQFVRQRNLEDAWLLCKRLQRFALRRPDWQAHVQEIVDVVQNLVRDIYDSQLSL